VDSSGNAYVTGATNSPNFPLVNPLLPNCGSDFCVDGAAFVAQISHAPVVTLSPSSLNFGNQNVGTTSAAQNVTLTNSGNASLSISSIVARGDFAQTNTCPVGGNLAAGSKCAISVTFTPSVAGMRNGAVTITDSASNSPQTGSLSGTGAAPAVMLSPPSVNFGDQPVGTPATAPVTLTNTGNAALTISSIAIAGANPGDFSEINTCGTSVGAAGTCQITVKFTPTVVGARNATINITDNGPGSPQMIILAGTGTVNGFAIAPASGSPTSAEVTPGNGASFTLTLTPSGSFGGTVNLACSVSPVVMRGPTCTLPTTVQVVAGTPANVPVTVNTTASTTAGTVAHVSLTPGAMPIAWAVFLFLSAFSLVVNRRNWPALAAPVLALAIISLAGCGGSGSSSSSSGTPLNTYAVTVTATSGSLTSKTTVTVHVQ
jgi:hypothetical protein